MSQELRKFEFSKNESERIITGLKCDIISKQPTFKLLSKQTENISLAVAVENILKSIPQF